MVGRRRGTENPRKDVPLFRWGELESGTNVLFEVIGGYDEGFRCVVQHLMILCGDTLVPCCSYRLLIQSDLLPVGQSRECLFVR